MSCYLISQCQHPALTSTIRNHNCTIMVKNILHCCWSLDRFVFCTVRSLIIHFLQHKFSTDAHSSHQTVKWLNRANVPHVTSVDGLFFSAAALGFSLMSWACFSIKFIPTTAWSLNNCPDILKLCPDTREGKHPHPPWWGTYSQSAPKLAWKCLGIPQVCGGS